MTSQLKVDRISPANTSEIIIDGLDIPEVGKNLIINGGFDVWQRGTSFTSSAVNDYSVDRFRTEGNAHNSTISQQTFTPSQTDVPDYPTHYCRIESSATVYDGEYWSFLQKIDTPEVTSGYETFTLSFWVKSPTGTIPAGAFSYGIKASKQNLSPQITTSWQKITHTHTANGPNTADYLSIYLLTLSEGQGNITLDIANVQLEVGETATDFDKRSYGEELALCQRYFFNAEDDDYFIDGFGVASGETYYRTILHPQSMRGNPAITISNEQHALVGAISVIRNYKTRWTYKVIGSSGANGSTAGNVQFDYTADAEL
jgi:hypothetical protein